MNMSIKCMTWVEKLWGELKTKKYVASDENVV